MVGVLDYLESRLCTDAERSFLATLGAGCSHPVAAYAVVRDNAIHLVGHVLHPSGHPRVKVTCTDIDPQRAGSRAAEQALAEGAAALLRRGPKELPHLDA